MCCGIHIKRYRTVPGFLVSYTNGARKYKLIYIEIRVLMKLMYQGEESHSVELGSMSSWGGFLIEGKWKLGLVVKQKEGRKS